jgi:hypothetical protein
VLSRAKAQGEDVRLGHLIDQFLRNDSAIR